ncbi:MAG: His/Gly/Thr/Pro-type tRNA ligase C-terminal domain-containing protein, partial [Anaerovoracaceae bacterium]|nr:His/Gly/Thr/Pro-type tRNA ligase C-terminal domain-containing protein [Anaerovoracaceae bacterium]
NPMRILDCKSPEDQKLVEGAPVMLDYLCDDCREAFEELRADLEAMGIEYIVDPGIVRGLDYYTKTAFEFISKNIGAQSTVCGGGRYDYLAEEIGGPHIPGVGFGLGIERLLITMEENGVVIPEPAGPDVFIVFVGDEAKRKALGLAAELRREGYSVALDDMARNVKGQFKYANRLGAAKTLVLGEDEIKAGTVAVKDMETGEQKEVAIERLADALK